MSDLYKLVFRGEVLEGQHPAVVRKRLAAATDFNEEALDKLFSGRAVVLKREADTATAARLQALFKKAGARLRVLPVEKDQDLPASADESTAEGGDLQLLPTGSALLRDDERSTWEPREVDTGRLSLEAARFLAPEAEPTAEGPDVSHLSVADVGADLAPPREAPEPVREVPGFEVAAPGVDLAPQAAPAAPAVDFSRLSFDVAPAGSDLGQRQAPPSPPAPDVSHLSVE